MLPIRWDPLREMGRDFGSFHRDMDDLLRRTFGTTREPLLEGGVLMAPPINTFVKDRKFWVQAEIPGIDRKDLDVTVEGNTLTIRGERKVTKETKEQNYMVHECQYGTFLRRLALPDGVNADKVHATYKDGMLEITMPMDKAVGGRKVLIEGTEEGKKEREIH